MNEPELSIIIVSWNVADHLRRCLLSIKKFALVSHEVIIVDNNSSDNSQEMVKNDFPEYLLIANQKNVGFAAANNQALSRAEGKWLLVLNPDTVLFKETIQNCLLYLKNNLPVGVLGCKILNPDLSVQPSCRRLPDLLSQALILLKIHNFYPSLKPIRKYLMKDFNYQETREVDQVMGAFLMTKREVIEKVGFFDPNFFVWFEEVDFCKRVKQIGYKVMFFHKAKIIHQKGESFKQLMALKAQMNFNKSLAYYFKKNQSSWSYYIILALFPLSYLLASLVALSKFFGFLKKEK